MPFQSHIHSIKENFLKVMSTSQDLLLAKKLLQENKLVAIPTETVYGLAANALESEAVAKIFQAKKRPTFDPLIVHVANISEVSKYVESFPEAAQKLADAFWPGPLTLILPKKNNIPDLVTSGMDTVAIRIPNHPLTLALLETLDFPLAAPSANPFGYVSPTTAAHVKKQLGSKIDYILDGGACEIGIESTIVGFPGGKPYIYRLGGVSLESIEQVIGKVTLQSHSNSNPQAPGMLSSHYAPAKPLHLLEDRQEAEKWIRRFPPENIGTIVFDTLFPQIPIKNQIILSKTRNFQEAAQNLFAALRSLDRPDIQLIISEMLPEKDLGRAVNDRLRRASTTHQSFD